MACDAAGKDAFTFWSNIGVYISHVLLGKLGFFQQFLGHFLLLQKLFSHMRTLEKLSLYVKMVFCSRNVSDLL